MTTALGEALAAIETALPAAAVFIPIPDTHGTTTHGRPGSRPPWNQAAANAVYDAHAGLRRLHNMFHTEVTGRPLTHNPPGGHATGTHIRAIAALAANVSPGTAREATHMVIRWVTVINQLPARDLEEKPQRVTAAKCYHCQVPMLRLFPRSGRVTCVRSGACYDCNGQHPTGFVRRGLDGEPLVEWADGCLQYGTPVSA